MRGDCLREGLLCFFVGRWDGVEAVARDEAIDLAENAVDGRYVAVFHVDAAEDSADGSDEGLGAVPRDKAEFVERGLDVVVHGFEFAVCGQIDFRWFVGGFGMGCAKEFVAVDEGGLRQVEGGIAHG